MRGLDSHFAVRTLIPRPLLPRGGRRGEELLVSSQAEPAKPANEFAVVANWLFIAFWLLTAFWLLNALGDKIFGCKVADFSNQFHLVTI